MEQTPLGKSSPYIQHYSPDLLVPITRQPIREKLHINTSRMHGIDIWNHWEVSFLNKHGKPQIACLSLSYDAFSPCIVESKSLKLYFNSFNQTQYDSLETLIEQIKLDLEAVVSAPVTITILTTDCLQTGWINDYNCIDDIESEFIDYQPNRSLLTTGDTETSQKLCSHLFKTNCMVTGQPDWASVFIVYRGREIKPTGLLHYLVSFRDHQAFHEPSCEMIFSDIMSQCKPKELSVYCRYTRRGGIDINPYRTTGIEIPQNLRILRQ